MIPYTDEDGLRNYRARAAASTTSRRRKGWLLTILCFFVTAFAIILLGLAIGCTRVPKLLVLVVPVPRHDIGAWLDTDDVCLEIPSNEALYLHRRCLPMRTIRSLILTARNSDDQGHP